MSGYLMAMRRYSVFSARSDRPEFWYFNLFYMIGYSICYAVDLAVFGQALPLFSGLFSLAHILPAIAVSVRRLHDLDRSGWWYLIVLTRIGAIVLFVWDCMRGTPGPNRFGQPAIDRLIAVPA